jgi:hypothetical protein
MLIGRRRAVHHLAHEAMGVVVLAHVAEKAIAIADRVVRPEYAFVSLVARMLANPPNELSVSCDRAHGPSKSISWIDAALRFPLAKFDEGVRGRLVQIAGPIIGQAALWA